MLKQKIRKAALLRHPHNSGYCCICNKNVTFYKTAEWLRDNYRCSGCWSIPRNRALINALNVFYPGWKNQVIHESSPGGPVSKHLKQHCKNYSSSYCYEDVPRGDYKGEYRSEDVSDLSFDDNSIDLFITSDVFEHVMEPEKAFKEIARVLKKGGAHVFTMPWYPKLEKTIQRAAVVDNKITHLLEPVYHGNPISEEGSLVTFDWGKDFCNRVYEYSGMYTTIYLVNNPQLGLEAEFLEVFISNKI